MSEITATDPLLLMCFRFADRCETHWVSATSESQARQLLVEDHDFDEDDLKDCLVVTMHPTQKLYVRPDGYYSDPRDSPATAICYNVDTVFNWCQFTGVGLIASTCY